MLAEVQWEPALTGVAVMVAVISALVANRAREDARRAADAAQEHTAIETARRTDELAERAEAVAAAGRADVKAAVAGSHLVVRNDGPALARSVRFIPIDSSAVFWTPDGGNVLDEVFDLRKDERRVHHFSAYAHHPRKLITATLEWIDGDGTHTERQEISTI